MGQARNSRENYRLSRVANRLIFGVSFAGETPVRGELGVSGGVCGDVRHSRLPAFGDEGTTGSLIIKKPDRADSEYLARFDNYPQTRKGCRYDLDRGSFWNSDKFRTIARLSKKG